MLDTSLRIAHCALPRHAPEARKPQSALDTRDPRPNSDELSMFNRAALHSLKLFSTRRKNCCSETPWRRPWSPRIRFRRIESAFGRSCADVISKSFPGSRPQPRRTVSRAAQRNIRRLSERRTRRACFSPLHGSITTVRQPAQKASATGQAMKASAMSFPITGRTPW